MKYIPGAKRRLHNVIALLRGVMYMKSMHKSIRLFAIISILLFMIIESYCSVMAGTLNLYESEYVDFLHGTFQYGDYSYAVTSEYMDKEIAYMQKDKVDWSRSNQVDAVAEFYANIKKRIDLGYLYQVSFQGTQIKQDDNKLQDFKKNEIPREDKSKKEKQKDKQINQRTSHRTLNSDVTSSAYGKIGKEEKTNNMIKSTGFNSLPEIIFLAILGGVYVVIMIIGIILGIKKEKELSLCHNTKVMVLYFIVSSALVVAGIGFIKSNLKAKIAMLLYQETSRVEHVDSYSHLEQELISADENAMVLPNEGEMYASIQCERIGLLAPLYYGDTDKILRNGVGQFADGTILGTGGSHLIAGHDTTYFACLAKIEIGDEILIQMKGVSYSYEVVETSVMKAEQFTMDKKESDNDQLILYTCYPIGDTLGDRSKRLFVYCNLISNCGNEKKG